MNEYIEKIIKLSLKAYNKQEVPVGCLIVKNNIIISQAYNKKETTKKVTKHAEIIAIEQACNKLNTYHLEDCTLYVTLEPCKMCCGAIEQSYISNVVYLINNDKYGDLININKKINVIKIENKFYLEQYTNLIQKFFKNKRK